MSISIERVKNALFDIDQKTDVFYLPELDRFVYQTNGESEFDLDHYRGDVISMPSHYEINNYQIMQDFIERKTTGDAREWLSNAIIGRGAFHRFRVTCERFGLLKDWYAFEENAYEDMAVLWCEDNGLEYYYEETVKPDEDEDIEEEVRETVTLQKPTVRIVDIDEKNAYAISYMVVEFRKVLSSLKNWESDYELEDASEEINDYLKKHYPVFAASISGRYVGYAVCRIDSDVVWLESIYVRNEYRRQGIASKLLKRCEEVGRELGNETLYVYIHPNNDAVISFLNENGYNVLNLIEVRKAYNDEKTDTEYGIGKHKYKY